MDMELSPGLVAKWRSCWAVVRDPSPGVAVAMPYDCRVAKNAPGRTFTWNPFSLSPGRVDVSWMGWDPDRGIVFAIERWSCGKGKPQPPQEGWMAASTLRKSSIRSGDDVLCDGLPFPPWAGKDDGMTSAAAAELRGENVREFLSCLPERTIDCLLILNEMGRDSHAFLSSDRLMAMTFRDRSHGQRKLDLAEASMLLGEQPPAGLSAEEAGHRRRQFVLSFPVFAASCQNLLPFIDRGDEAVSALAKFHSLSEPVIRAFARVPRTNAAFASMFLRGRRSARIVDAMPASWLTFLPELSAASWNSLRGLADAIPDHYPPSRAKVIGEYIGSTLAPDPDSGFDWLAVGGLAWPHLNDVAKNMVDELAFPALARNDASVAKQSWMLDACRDALLALGPRKLQRALATHLAGTVHGARLGCAIQQGVDGDFWGEAAPRVVAPGGLVLRFLGSQDELDQEAQAMRHCVDTYGEACARRTSAIMSIGRMVQPRNGSGRWVPSSTAEIRAPRSPGSLELVIGQHYGPGNGSAPDANARALRWWLDEVQAGRIVLAPGSLEYKSHSDVAMERLPRLLGDGWRSPQAHAYRWDRWRRILDVRNRCFGDWLLALPRAFLDAAPQPNAKLAALAVDMDTEMEVLKQVEALDADDADAAFTA